MIPDKIYLNTPKIQPELDNTTWDTKAWKDCENIEYIRKDALLEWAKEHQEGERQGSYTWSCYQIILDKLNSM